jgi:ketosteroid isomerase-like protein
VTPSELPQRYFECIRARDIDALIALYDEEASFVLPNGREFQGVGAIREMQLGVFAAGAPFPTPIAIVVGENAVAAEIEAKLPDGSVRRTANFWQLTGDGRIRRLSVYTRG